MSSLIRSNQSSHCSNTASSAVGAAVIALEGKGPFESAGHSRRISLFTVPTEPVRTKARLIPVSGIGSVQEAEQRATSALLAVLSVVRDLSIDLLSPLGASRAQKATVETFIEVNTPGKKIRPDGLIQVSFGKTTWSAFVEVKTGANVLEADQINAYWELAREYNFDHVLTISNEIAPKEGLHPTQGLKVRANARVGVSHLSWSAIVSSAVRIKRHKGIVDSEQAWLLDELIRYLQHPASGALDFADMGQAWVGVRDAAREETLTRRFTGIEDAVSRWDQLLRFAALQLSAEIGEDVDPVFPRGQTDHRQRTTALVDSLCATGRLAGALRIPNTAGDLMIEANLRSRRLTASVDIWAPQDLGARGRVSWLVNQLGEAPGQTVIDVYARNARVPTSATLEQTREDRFAPLDDEKREPHRFRVALRADMGMGRAAGKKSLGFITSVLGLITTFYGQVVQDVAPWQPPAPKLAKPSPVPESEETPEVRPDPQTFDPLPWLSTRDWEPEG